MKRIRSFDVAGQTVEYIRSLEGEIVHVATEGDRGYAGTLHWRVSNVKIEGVKWSATFTDVESGDFSEAELAIAQRVAADHAREYPREAVAA
jgi:hypothetical protein